MGVIGGRLPAARLRAHGDANLCEFNYLVHAYECVCAILGETIMYKTIIKVVNLMKFR